MLICFGGHGRSWLILCPVTPRFLRLEPYHVSHDCNDGVFVVLDTQKHSLHVSAIYSSSDIHCTPSWKQGLVFWLVHGMPLWQSSCVDPIWPEFEIWKIFHRRPAEILAPWTPGVSHGTKIFGSKIFSYHPQMMLFYAFWRFVMQKMLKIMKNCPFLHKCLVIGKRAKNRQFFMILSIFCTTNPQIA